MTKEFNIFPPDYMDGLLEYPRKVTFPSKNGKTIMFHFQDGYYSFDVNGKYNGYHLYVKDYQGNIRLVVNGETDSIEQVNHYYPYGALIGDICSGQDFQKYKYSGKELDRQFGLDWFDFHARQQDPLLGRFTSIDPLAEKYYNISPYAYCAGNPVNFVDKDGQCPFWVVTCTIGAIVGGGVGFASAIIEGKSGQEVLAATAGGAVAGAIAGTGAGLITELGIEGAAAFGISVGMNTLGNGAGNVTEQFISTGTVDSGEVGAAMVAGAASSAVSWGEEKVGKLVGSVFKTESHSVASRTKELKQDQKSGVKMGSKNGNKKLSDNDLKKKAEAEVKEGKKLETAVQVFGDGLNPFNNYLNNWCKDEILKRQ